MLIFAHHQAVLDGLQEALRANAVAFVRIDGQVSSGGGDWRHARRCQGFEAGLVWVCQPWPEVQTNALHP